MLEELNERLRQKYNGKFSIREIKLHDGLLDDQLSQCVEYEVYIVGPSGGLRLKFSFSTEKLYDQETFKDLFFDKVVTLINQQEGMTS